MVFKLCWRWSYERNLDFFVTLCTGYKLRPIRSTVCLITHSISVEKSQLVSQKGFKWCVCATLPGRGPNWSPRSWFESCSPQGSAQDLDSQTEDTWLPERASEQNQILTFSHLHFKYRQPLNGHPHLRGQISVSLKHLLTYKLISSTLQYLSRKMVPADTGIWVFYY